MGGGRFIACRKKNSWRQTMSWKGLFIGLCIGTAIALVSMLFTSPSEDIVTVGAALCPQMTCNSTSETGFYCRVSSTGYRAYPDLNTTAGYRDCINRTSGARGVWTETIAPTQSFNYTFEPNHCMIVGNDSLWCFASFNRTMEAIIIAEIAR